MPMASEIQSRLFQRMPYHKPAEVSDREWRILVAHVIEDRTYTDLARVEGLSYARIRQIAHAAALRMERLGYLSER